jgi:ribulose-5-phosphate 4-epimerase/fuculose-1-phosphate aldolase
MRCVMHCMHWVTTASCLLLLSAAFHQTHAAEAGSMPADTDEQRIADLITANHILFSQGVLDAYGHVSVRSLQRPDHYFISRSRAPGLVAREDILELDGDSVPIGRSSEPLYLERFIHGEIYRARNDVQGIVHAHAAAIIPYSVTNVPLRPIFHMAGFLPDVVPVFESRSSGDMRDNLLIDSQASGVLLASALGAYSVVLMRGHGMVVVGPSVRHAVFRSIYTVANAKIETDAIRLGAPVFLNAKEAAKVNRTNESTLLSANPRQWNLWAAMADSSPPSK